MVWTFFVLDFDITYDMEDGFSNGVQPLVYLIPLDRQRDVEHYARMARDDFHANKNIEEWTIADCFEEWMWNNNCDFKVVGKIDLTFGERQVDYLADYIPREIV